MHPLGRKLAFAAAGVALGLAALACSRGGGDDDDGGGGGAPAPGSSAPGPTSPGPTSTGTPSNPPSPSPGPSPTSPPPGPSSSSPGPTPTSTSPGGSGPPAGPVGELFGLVNAARGEARSCGGQGFGAAPALRWDDRLGRAAQAHSDDMAARDYFDHDTLEGVTPEERVAAQGYSFSSFGENIAAGQPTPAQAMATWLASDGHCANLMNPDFVDFGAGLGEGGSYGFYWTQVFAAPL
jgi:uncharacterized protein YkwD